jgi:hypothetical protein
MLRMTFSDTALEVMLHAGQAYKFNEAHRRAEDGENRSSSSILDGPNGQPDDICFLLHLLLQRTAMSLSLTLR